MASVARYCCCGGTECFGPFGACCFGSDSSVRLQVYVDLIGSGAEGGACGNSITQDFTLPYNTNAVWTDGTERVEFRAAGNQWAARTWGAGFSPSKCGVDISGNAFPPADCCGDSATNSLQPVYVPGVGASFLWYVDWTITVQNNPCCKNGIGECVQGSDANCNGECDEDEV